MIFLLEDESPALPPPSLLPFRPGVELAEADAAATTLSDVTMLLMTEVPLVETIVVVTRCVVLPVGLEVWEGEDPELSAWLDWEAAVVLDICDEAAERVEDWGSSDDDGVAAWLVLVDDSVDSVDSSTEDEGVSDGVALGGGDEVEGVAVCEADELTPVPKGTTWRSMSLSISVAADIVETKKRRIHREDVRRDIISSSESGCSLLAETRPRLQGFLSPEGLRSKGAQGEGAAKIRSRGRRQCSIIATR